MKPKPPFGGVDAYEDSIEVYFDPVDEEGSIDCEHIYRFGIPKEGGEPVASCVKCGRAAT